MFCTDQSAEEPPGSLLQSTQFDVEKDIVNRLITSHEHISQRKFNQAAVVVLKEYDKEEALQEQIGVDQAVYGLRLGG
jgi:hypothetical protein